MRRWLPHIVIVACFAIGAWSFVRPIVWPLGGELHDLTGGAHILEAVDDAGGCSPAGTEYARRHRLVRDGQSVCCIVQGWGRDARCLCQISPDAACLWSLRSRE